MDERTEMNHIGHNRPPKHIIKKEHFNNCQPEEICCIAPEGHTQQALHSTRVLKMKYMNG